MDQDIKQRWVEALRSGEYEQGRMALRVDGRYCCLGVLCDLVEPNEWRSFPDDEGIYFHGDGMSQVFPPESVLRLAGLPTTPVELARRNDDGEPFAEIADYIETNL